MKKQFFCTAGFALLFSTFVFAQPNEASISVAADPARAGRVVFKAKNPAQDQTNQFEITALGGSSFTAINVSDGTTNSYKHNLRVTIDLVPATKSGTNQFQLVFYSNADEVPQAAHFNNGALSIYYPISLYTSIKERLDLALAAKKKVVVKVTQRTDGYREGSLIF